MCILYRMIKPVFPDRFALILVNSTGICCYESIREMILVERLIDIFRRKCEDLSSILQLYIPIHSHKLFGLLPCKFPTMCCRFKICFVIGNFSIYNLVNFPQYGSIYKAFLTIEEIAATITGSGIAFI